MSKLDLESLFSMLNCNVFDKVVENRINQAGSLIFFLDTVPEWVSVPEKLDRLRIKDIKSSFVFLANISNNNQLMADISSTICEEIQHYDIGSHDISLLPLTSRLSIRLNQENATLISQIACEECRFLFTNGIKGEELVNEIKWNFDISCKLAQFYIENFGTLQNIDFDGKSFNDFLNSIVKYNLKFCRTFFLQVPCPTLNKTDKIFILNAAQIESFISLAVTGILQLIREKVIVQKCKICGTYFIPASRSDELYCDDCKAISYDIKIKSDEILNNYRRIYKTQNARKARNAHIADISDRFQYWTKKAKKTVSDCQKGEISLEEMIQRISSDEWIEDENYGQYKAD